MFQKPVCVILPHWSLLFSFALQHNFTCGWGNLKWFCSFCPQLPRIHFGLHCNPNEKVEPWKKLLILPFVPYQVSFKDTLNPFVFPTMQQLQTTPFFALRRTDNLSDILVRSKLRTDKQTNVTNLGILSMLQKLHLLPLYHRRCYKLYLFCHWRSDNHSWSYRLQL